MAFPKYIFLTSLAITLLVFVAGLFLGWNLDSLRSSELLSDLRNNELDTESYLVERAFWDSYGGEDCNFAELRLNVSFLLEIIFLVFPFIISFHLISK